MNKMKKLLSVLLAVVLALSCMSVMASAKKTAYKTVDELTALDAYSPYGQVTRLSLEERTSIVFDALDNLLPSLNINMGKVFDVLGLSVTIDLTSVDRLCYSFDTIEDTFTNTLASIAMAIVDLGILEYLDVSTWQTGMSRDGTAQFTILSEILELLSKNAKDDGLIQHLFSDGLDLGLVSLGDMSAIEDIIMNLPGMVKGLIYPMIERWDDSLELIKTYDNSIAGKGSNVEAIANMRVKKLFSDNMSITTIKYDVDGNMTSEHKEQWLATATGTAAPTAPTANSPRCYYQFSSTTPGSVMTVWHIVDAAEAKALAKTPDKVNGSPAAYTYFKEAQTFVMAEEVKGSGVYVWRATDELGNSWSLKWYNDDSQLLPGFSGDEIDLTKMSAGELLYKFIPVLFNDMAPVVLNGSVKKILAEFFGAKFTYVGEVGSDAVEALPDSSNKWFTAEQGDYMFPWSDYIVIGSNHYWRYEDQIWAGDISAKNNYFDIINWDYKITGDFMNDFVPKNGGTVEDRLLVNLNDFLVKVATTITKASAETADTQSDYTATWTRPTFKTGSNAYAVENIKAAAQAVISLAPQHIFGSDYATNPRCYYSLLIDSNNDNVLTGLAATLVDALMPSVTLPTAAELKADGTKVGAILAGVVREFAAYLAPEYNFDALIYSDFGTTEADKAKTFVAGKDSEYWFDVILTMGINVGFEYLRAFADMGEGTTEWNAFVDASGYKVDGGTYTEADLKLGQAVNHWEAMLDYIVDWALTTDKEWCWKMGNIVNYTGTVNLGENNDPWEKIDSILFSIIPFDEILKIEPAAGQTKFEHFLREDLILGIVDLKWDHLINTIQFSEAKVDTTNGNVFRQANVLDQLAKLLKRIVNSIFVKGNKNNDFALIPAAITDFDTLATQANIVTLVKELVGVLHNAFVTDKFADTIFPFLNFLLGWKTDPQKIADPKIWTDFRDGNDYAFMWNETNNAVVANGAAINGDGKNSTKIKVLNNSAGMLETHRKSNVTDHAYDIQIKSVTSDAKTNTLTFTYGDGDGLISPYETLDIIIGGTYNGEEAATITIAYDYVGKDGQAIGGTQYTSLTILFSNQYEDANISGRVSGDADSDYSGTDDFKRYQFTEDIYETVTNYQARIFYVGSTFSNPDKSKGAIAAPDYDADCNGKHTKDYFMSANADKYFDFRAADADAGFESTLSKDGNPDTYGYLYKAASGVTADTVIPSGEYYMGRIAVAYGKHNIRYEITFIQYNDYDIYDIYTENQWNGYNANQGVASSIYDEYNAAWKDIVKYATYPMMTAENGNTTTAYTTAVEPYIPAAIERFEAAKAAYEEALADAQASGAGAALPQYIQNLQAEIDNDFMNGKEINFQDYEFYEYFNYQDVKNAAENLYRSYLQPEVMDKYYIQGSGIREAELDLVADAEASASKTAGILASRLENNADAIAASQVAHDEWKMPVTTKLVADDFTSRLGFYKKFLNEANREGNDHLKFLEKEIAHIEAQGLAEADYETVSWGRYEKALADAKAVAAGTDEFASFNSRIYDVKYNLMVAYKQLLKWDDSLIKAGGTADLLANIETAEAIFASMDANDGAWVLKEGVDADEAYAALISALGYEYQARYSENDIEVENGTKNAGDLKYNEDGSPMMFDLYADSAYEYAKNDRPNKTGNQAKVNAANAKLVEAIANFESAAAPELILKEEGAKMGAVVDTTTESVVGEGFIYGINVDQGESIENYFETPAGSVRVTPNENGVYSTGATVELLDTDGTTVLETYHYIFFGDVNGDGWVDSGDVSTIDGVAAYMLFDYGENDGSCASVASDVNGDGWIDSGDVSTVDGIAAYMLFPTQADIAAEVTANKGA